MFENKNILFVYSGLDNNLKVQQSFVFIKSLIDEFKEDCKSISILTTTDEMGLFVFDENIKIYQNAVNEKTIIDVIDERKIDVLVSICGCEQTDKIINSIYRKLKDKKVKLFQDDYFSQNQSKTYLQDIAKKSGFSLYKKRISQKKELCKEFFATCINDNFGNQVIFDICDYALINEKPFFLSPSILLNGLEKSNVMRMLKNFGNTLYISNVPYTIHFNIYTDGKVYFDSIEFGFSYEMIFVLNSKRINIQDIILNCTKSLPIHYKLILDYFSYSYDYATNCKLNFSINYEELNFIASPNNVYRHTNNSLFYRICLLNKLNKGNIGLIRQHISQTNYDRFYIQTDINNSIKYYNAYEECILVYCDDETLNDIGNLIIFISLCNRLKLETNKKLYFISSTYVPLFKYCKIDAFFIICNNLIRNTEVIIKHLNIKKAFLNSFQNNEKMIDLLQNNKISIYGFNYDDEILYRNDLYKKELFCETLGLKYNEFYEDDSVVYDFFCIKDKHNNEYQQTIINNIFFKDINSCGLLHPFIEINFDVKEQLNNAINNILPQIKTCGIINIKIIYHNGDIYINNIDVKMSIPILFKLNLQDKNKYFDCLIDAILGKNIDIFIRSNISNNCKKNNKTIICNLPNNKTLTIKGKTKECILSKFKKIIINNDK